MQTVIGYLRNISDRFFYFEADDGKTYDLLFTSKHNTPINTKIALTISEVPNDNAHYEVIPPGKYYSLISIEAFVVSEPIEKKHIALFRQVFSAESEENVAKELAKAKIRARKLEDFWRYFSRNKWDVEVRAYTLVSRCSPNSGFCKTEIQDYIRNTDMEDFEPNYYHNWFRTTISRYCGLGEVGQPYSDTYEGCSVGTTCHELGHNFGLHHANAYGVEYEDLSCIMGRSQNMSGVNSMHLLQLGLENPREIKIVDYSQQVLLCPIELTEHAMHEIDDQNIILRKSNTKDLQASIRKDKGFQYHPGKNKGNILYIHEKAEGKSNLIETILPGERKYLSNRIVVDYLEYTNETAKVNFEFSDDIDIIDMSIPTDFPEKLASIELGKQHNGLWYDADFNGQGFDVQIRNNRLTVFWYTFNEKETSRRFYYGTCDLQEGTEKFDLYTTKNGTFEDPTLAEDILAGTGQLYFFNDTTGIFNFNMDEYGRGSVEITPVALSNHEMNGLWYIPERNKEGFSIQFFDQLNSCVAYWYTYGPKPKPGSIYDRYKGIQTQRWFMCQGEKLSDKEYSLTIFEVRNGSWLFFDDVDIVSVGEATLKIIDNDNIKFTYDIDADW